jgi:hypothetical protein
MADRLPEPIDGAGFALRETAFNGRESREQERSANGKGLRWKELTHFYGNQQSSFYQERNMR